MKLKKIVLAGGTGFLGQIIIERFKGKTEEIVVLSRSSKTQQDNVRTVVWDAKNAGDWTKELSGTDVLINLTGKSINCRHNEANKKELLSSRIDATEILGKAIEACEQAPKLWINASAAALYIAGSKPNTENDSRFGNGFLEEMCIRWEESFLKSKCPQTRKIIMRITLILGKSGGVFPVLMDLTKKGLGGKAGSGKQMMSWMHENDFLNAINWFIRNENAIGVYNMSSPQPISNKDFMALLRKNTNALFGLPAPAFAIRLASIFMQTEPGLVLNSVHVLPQKLLDNGFHFEFAKAKNAIASLCKKVN